MEWGSSHSPTPNKGMWSKILPPIYKAVIMLKSIGIGKFEILA